MMKKILLWLILYFSGCISITTAQTVNIQSPNDLPQTVYGAERLKGTLLKHGYVSKEGQVDVEIRLALDNSILGSEEYSISNHGQNITITGGDERGIIYGCLSLAEDIDNGIPLQKAKPRRESPKVPFRAIKFNLPWDAYREGYAMQLHMETCRDTAYWKAFLDMMVENRFNALTLWNLHPFPFMIKPKNFPEASPFNDKELAEWKALYRSLFRMAKARGIDTYIVNWNIFVTPEFAKAHSEIKLNNIHFGKGDTSAIVKRYTRECVTQVLEEYPDLSGIGLTEGEAMDGMTPQERQQWVDETIIAGVRLAHRKSKLIFRGPLSAGVNDGGSTSVSTEQLTRNAIEGYHFLEGPIWVEMKFNWSHGHSTTKLLKVHGGKLKDTYFNPVPQNYKMVWTVRNEDFFCLRWGVPSFIRDHIAANTPAYVGGYIIGSEGYIPAKDYFTKAGNTVNWKYAFERQWLFYTLWGRLLYNPATPDDVFRNAFIRRYGKGSGVLLDAYAYASKTPLRLASFFDFTWDFSLYSEGFMAMDKQNMAYISADRLINQPVADPDYVSILNYVKAVSNGGSFQNNKITPPVLAKMLAQDCQKAMDLVKGMKSDPNDMRRYEIADIKTWANLGLHFSEKLLGAVALQTYRIKGGEENKRSAVRHMEKALHYWDAVITITHPLYNDMPLAAFSYPHGGNRALVNTSRRFHWERLRPEVAEDVETAKNAQVNKDHE